MARLTIILVLTLCSLNAFSQHDYKYKDKVYTVYYSFEEADKVNPDSVKGLVLKSKGFKNFPTQILKYKNLEVLDLSAFNWDEAYDTLMSKSEKQKRDKKAKKLGNLYFPPCYKPNLIFDLPVSELKELKKLIFMNIDCCGRKAAKLCELLKLMPQLEIDPDVEHMMYINTGQECKCR
ncbi:MAG: hypothetical protein ACXVPN_03925 [Bacteroidia bacterium]